MLSTNRDTATVESARSESSPFSRTYAWTNVTPSTAIVETVADAMGVDPIDLDQLRHFVDPDALDTLVQPNQSGAPRDLRISFTYHDYFVVVRETGQVTLFDLDG